MSGGSFDVSYCEGRVDCKVFTVETSEGVHDHREGLIVVGVILAFILGLLLCFIISRTCLRRYFLKRAKQVADKKNSEKNEKRLKEIERKKQARLVYEEHGHESSSVSSTSSSDNCSSSDDEENINQEYLDRLEKKLEQDTETPVEMELRNVKAKWEQKVKKLVVEEEEMKMTESVNGQQVSMSDLKVFLPLPLKYLTASSPSLAQALVNHQIVFVERELIVQDGVRMSRLLNETRVHMFKCIVHILRLLLYPLKKQQRIEQEVVEQLLNTFNASLEEGWSRRKREVLLKMKRVELEETTIEHKKPSTSGGMRSSSNVNKLDKVKQMSEQEILAAKKDTAIGHIQSEIFCECNRVVDSSVQLVSLMLRSELNGEETSGLLNEFKLHLNNFLQLTTQHLINQHMMERSVFEKRKKLATSQCIKRCKMIEVMYRRLDTMAVILNSTAVAVTTNNNISRINGGGGGTGGSSLTTKQLQPLIAHYDTKCLQHIQHTLQAEKESLESVANRLNEEREQRLSKLEGEQLHLQKEQDLFGNNSSKSIKKPHHFIQEYYELLEKQSEERWKLLGTIDEYEAKTMAHQASTSEQVRREVSEVERSFTEWLTTEGHLPQSEVNYILNSFQNEQSKFIDRSITQAKQEVEEANKQYHANIKENIVEEIACMKMELRMENDVVKNTMEKILTQYQHSLDEKAKELLRSEFEFEMSRLQIVLLFQKLVQLKVKELSCADRKCRSQIFIDRQKEALLSTPYNQRVAATANENFS